jgi:SAM-dependent methyltransferase
MVDMPDDEWGSGDRYEPYVGRWSRAIADRFVTWVRPAPGGRWIDVGCGTGALTDTVLVAADPASVLAVDRSAAYLAYARPRLAGRPVGVGVADAAALPAMSGSVDYVVSGLMLNFLPDPARAVAEMTRACRPGGVVAAYVWDYAVGMQPIRVFWDAAVAIDPAAAELDEGRRFPLCRPDRLAALFERAGLARVDTTSLSVPAVFGDFEDYWTPFLGGQGPAPTYCVKLSRNARQELRDRLRTSLPGSADGSIPLSARAWAVRGTVA